MSTPLERRSFHAPRLSRRTTHQCQCSRGPNLSSTTRGRSSRRPSGPSRRCRGSRAQRRARPTSCGCAGPTPLAGGVRPSRRVQCRGRGRQEEEEEEAARVHRRPSTCRCADGGSVRRRRSWEAARVAARSRRAPAAPEGSPAQGRRRRGTTTSWVPRRFVAASSRTRCEGGCERATRTTSGEPASATDTGGRRLWAGAASEWVRYELDLHGGGEAKERRTWTGDQVGLVVRWCNLAGPRRVRSR